MTSPLRGREGSVKNGVLRQFLGLKLRRQGEGGGSRNPKFEEMSFMDFPLPFFPVAKEKKTFFFLTCPEEFKLKELVKTRSIVCMSALLVMYVIVSFNCC